MIILNPKRSTETLYSKRLRKIVQLITKKMANWYKYSKYIYL